MEQDGGLQRYGEVWSEMEKSGNVEKSGAMWSLEQSGGVRRNMEKSGAMWRKDMCFISITNWSFALRQVNLYTKRRRYLLWIKSPSHFQKVPHAPRCSGRLQDAPNTTTYP